MKAPIAALVLCLVALSPRAVAQDMAPGEGDPHAGVPGAPQRERSLATAEPSADVPRGSIRVRVVNAAGDPVANAELNVGSMGQGGERNRVLLRTDATGVATFSGLGTGGGQAYRVNHPFDGATYSSTPFQIPNDHGYLVQITELPTTRNDRFFVQAIGLTMVEFRENRLHISQQSRLMNLGEETYVFPTTGITLPLPRGFIAAESQPVMTDQRMTVTSEGFKLVGSMPPGSVMLSWSFDLPITDTVMHITQNLPIRTLQYRVIAEAAPGLSLDADGFPPPEAASSNGQRLFVTDVERPASDPLRRLDVRLRGIPGPSPVRWVAVFVAIAFVLGGALLAQRQPKARAVAKDTISAERDALLEDILALRRELDAGKIGPKYFAKQRDEIATRLAVVLKAEAGTTTRSGETTPS